MHLNQLIWDWVDTHPTLSEHFRVRDGNPFALLELEDETAAIVRKRDHTTMAYVADTFVCFISYAGRQFTQHIFARAEDPSFFEKLEKFLMMYREAGHPNL